VGDSTLTSGSVEFQSMDGPTGFTATMTLPDGRRLHLSGSSLDCVAYPFGGCALTAHGTAGILSCNCRGELTHLQLWPHRRSSDQIIDVNLSTLCVVLADPRAPESVTGTSCLTKKCSFCGGKVCGSARFPRQEWQYCAYCGVTFR